jgi:hypothetical protein
VAFIIGMSQPRSRSTVPATTPSLVEVQQDLTILTGLPLPIVVDLRRQISHLAADVDAVLYQILSEAGTKDQRSDAEPDRWLTPQAAAARFGVTKRWLLDHADEIPKEGAAKLQTLHEAQAPPTSVIRLTTATTTKRVSSSTGRVSGAQRARRARAARAKSLQAGEKTMVGWDGIEPPTPGFPDLGPSLRKYA